MDPLLLGSSVAYESAYSQCMSSESITSRKWRGQFSKQFSCSVLLSVCVTLEIGSKRASALRGGRKVGVCPISPGFFLHLEASCLRPRKAGLSLAMSWHRFPPYSESEETMVSGSRGMGSSCLRVVMELVVKITRLCSVEQGCVHEKRMLRRGKDLIFRMVLF